MLDPCVRGEPVINLTRTNLHERRMTVVGEESMERERLGQAGCTWYRTTRHAHRPGHALSRAVRSARCIDSRRDTTPRTQRQRDSHLSKRQPRATKKTPVL